MGMIANLYVKLGLKNDSFNKGLNESKKKTSAFGNTMKKVGGMIAGAFALGAVVAGVKKFIQVNAEFEQSIASLGSITGATGKDLQFYEEQAIALGSTTTLSASQVAKAFELVGSAKPELLKSKEALAAVTTEAIALAEAAGMELPQAASALTGAMNQFGLPASEAARVINVLAAGSKEGSSDIDSLNESMKNVGAVASGAGLSLEQTVGALETLGEKQIKGAEAGTALRGVIMKLQAAGVGYESGTFNLSDALAEANKRIDEQTTAVDKDAQAQKLFGVLNITAGKIMMENVGTYERLSGAVTGTTTAYEQQAKNTNTLQASFKGLKSAIEGIILSFRGSMGVLKPMVDGVTNFLNKLRVAIPQMKEFFKSNEAVVRGIKLIGDWFNHVWSTIVDGSKEMIIAVINIANSFIALYNESEGFRKTLVYITTLFKVMAKVGVNNIKTISNAFGALAKWIKSGFKGDAWSTFWDETQAMWLESGKELKKDFDENVKKAINAEKIDFIVTPKFDFSSKSVGGAKVDPVDVPARISIEDPKSTLTPVKLGGFVDIDYDALDERLKKIKEYQEKEIAQWNDFTAQMEKMTTDFAANVVSEFAAGIGEMVAAGDFSSADLGKGVLSAMGGFLSQMGEMMIAYGVANSAFAAALKAPGNPVSAGALIVAGAAMVAIGAAISASAAKMGSSGSSSSDVNVSSGSYSRTNMGSTTDTNQVISLNAVLSGDNIYLSNERNTFKKGSIG